VAVLNDNLSVAGPENLNGPAPSRGHARWVCVKSAVFAWQRGNTIIQDGQRQGVDGGRCVV